MSDVVIIQRVLPHYRVEFFEQLAGELARRGNRLRLIYGQAFAGEVPVSVQFERPWAVRIENHYFAVAGRWMAWQPVLPHLSGTQLVIIEQSNRLLINYALHTRLVASGAALAYWGHGRNRQAQHPDSLPERLKRRLRLHVDWWFAYTETVAAELAAAGYPKHRITVVDNAIDDVPFRRAVSHHRADPSFVEALHNRLGRRGALYCGGLQASKRPEFLIASADCVRRVVPDFQLAIIGDGPARPVLDTAAKSRPWLHMVGALHDSERVPWFLASRVQLMPGVVGLGILDSFLAGCPLVTTDIPGHGPEIDYLVNGVNGVVSSNDRDRYAAEVLRILSDDLWHARLAHGCAMSASRYTLANMVQRFAAGIEHCLSQREMRCAR